MVTRTVLFPLDLMDDQEKLLFETIDLYTKSWNYCVDVAWREEIKTGSADAVLDRLVMPAKIKFLPNCTFRRSGPAVMLPASICARNSSWRLSGSRRRPASQSKSPFDEET